MIERKSIADYAEAFSHQHPEVGTMNTGDVVSADSLSAFMNLMVSKARDIERKGLGLQIEDEALDAARKFTNRNERIFVKTTARILTKALAGAVEDYPHNLGNPIIHYAVHGVLNSAYLSSGDKPRERGHLRALDLHSHAAILRGLEVATDVIRGIEADDESDFNTHSTNLVNIIEQDCLGLVAIAEQEDGLAISTDLQGGLVNVLGQYEYIEALSR